MAETAAQRSARLRREAAAITESRSPATDAEQYVGASLFPGASVEVGPARVEAPATFRESLARAESPDYASAPRAARRREALVAAVERDRRRREARDASYRRAPLTEGVAGDLMSATDEAEAVQQGTLQGATLGFFDELAGASGSLAGRGEYDALRDEARENERRAATAAPGWYTAGNVLGGALPSLLIPAASAETVIGRMGQSALYGSGYGAIEGLGRGEGDVLDQGRSVLATAGVGALGGAVGQGLAEVPTVARAVREGDASRIVPRAPRPEREVIEPQYTQGQTEAIRQDPALRALEDRRRTAAREAAAQRVMGTAGAGATRTDLLRAADYPGGLEGLARDIRREGIVSPDDGALGGLIPPSGDVAQQRARFLAEDAGARVGDVEGRVHAAAEPGLTRMESQRRQVAGDGPTSARTGQMTPDEIAARDAALARLEAEEAQAIEARSPSPEALADWYREQGLNMPSSAPYRRPDVTAPTPRRAARHREQQAQQAQQRAVTGQQAVDEVQTAIAQRDAPNVDMGRVAERLQREAARIRTGNTPSAHREADDLEALARQYAQTWEVRLGTPRRGDAGLGDLDEATDVGLGAHGPETTARSMLDRQRREAGYGARAADANRPWAEEQARLVQRAIRDEMDAAMTRTLPPEEMAQALADRRSYQTASAVRQIGDAAESRRLGNRQMPLSDNIQVAAAEGLVGKARALIANRLVRGREHAFMAMLQEREANQLAREIVRRLSANGDQARAARVIAASRRGGPALGAALRQLTEEGSEGQHLVAESVAQAAPEVLRQEQADQALMRDLLPADEADAEPTEDDDEALMRELL